MEITMLVNRIKIANDCYRKGEAIMTDLEYDSLMDELRAQDPLNPILTKIGLTPDNRDSRKEKLPVFMGSLDKVKTMSEIEDWLNKKKISLSCTVVATPKYDGLSILKNERTGFAWTRGDGEVGVNITNHFTFVKNGNYTTSDRIDFSYGEAIISKKVFAEKYSKEYANPRNMVASLFNTNKPDYDKLKDVTYLRYGFIKEGRVISKVEQLKFLNGVLNSAQVPFSYGPFISEEGLTSLPDIINDLYVQWNEEFEIDGIVIDINDPEMVGSLGRESNRNPAYARAYKGDFEEIKETTINEIVYQISKHGKLCPVGLVTPVNLEGAEVSNVTLYNANYIIEKGIKIGSVIKLKRSGKVIPKIVEVLNPAENVDLPMVCPCCKIVVEWDENKVDLYCPNTKCEDRVVSQNVAFFELLGVEIGEPTIRKAYKAGFESIEQVCKMTHVDWSHLEGFALKSAEDMSFDIYHALLQATLKELMAASPYFPGLGLKTLNTIDFCIDINYLEDDDVYYNQQLHKLQDIDGIGFVSAQSYLSGLPNFYAFLRKLPVEFRVWDVEEKGDLFKDMVVVFTGFRDTELEKIITKGGGKVSTSVSKTTTIVVTNDLESSSSKMKKAIELGIEFIDLDSFKENYGL